MTALRIDHITGYATLQDHGRPGFAHLSIPPSGAFDRAAHDFANRLVGNNADAATIELTRATIQFTVDSEAMIAVTGAPNSIIIDGRQREAQRAILVPAGTPVLIATQHLGMRSYLAVRGGFDIEPVMGSRAYDELSRIGTPPLEAGQSLVIGTDAETTPAVARQVASGANVSPSVTLHIHKGPRWGFCDNSDALLDNDYIVTASLNRIGIRLSGPQIHWNSGERLPSEGVLTGSIQIAADGQPLIFGPDHPTTGGYPVIAVVDERALGTVAQLSPGTTIRFSQSHR